MVDPEFTISDVKSAPHVILDHIIGFGDLELIKYHDFYAFSRTLYMITEPKCRKKRHPVVKMNEKNARSHQT